MNVNKTTAVVQIISALMLADISQITKQTTKQKNISDTFKEVVHPDSYPAYLLL